MLVVTIDGIEVRCSTPAEALELIQLANSQKGSSGKVGPVPMQNGLVGATVAGAMTATVGALLWDDFLGRLKPQHLDVLLRIQLEGPVTLKQLKTALGASTTGSVTAYLTHIKRHAAAAGLDADALFDRTSKPGRGGGRITTLRPGPLLREYAIE